MGDTHNGRAVNSKQMLGDRSSSRVLAPPGGHSSFSLGGWDNERAPVRQQKAPIPSGKSKFTHNTAGDALDDLVKSSKRTFSHHNDANHGGADVHERSRPIPGLDFPPGSKFRSDSNHNSSVDQSRSIPGLNSSGNVKSKHQFGNSYASQLREQIEMKKRIDQDLESRYNSRSGDVPRRQETNGLDGGFQRHDAAMKGIANGRRGQNPAGGHSTFSLAW